jgi:hypothetical protein
MSETDEGRRIARGRRLVTGIVLFYAALAAAVSVRDWILAEAFAPAPLVRLIVTWLLLYLVYRGYVWARYLTVILFMLAAAVAGSFLMTEAAAGPLVFAGVAVAIFVVGFLVLGFSKSILLYERACQRDREAAGRNR